MKALVVEPSRVYRLLLNEFLYGYSISYEEVSTGDAALTELTNNKVDLVIVAMNLVDMTALTLAKQIKVISGMENCKIVVITGEQDQNKLAEMKIFEVNYVCQRNELPKLKDILTELTKNSLAVVQVPGRILYVEDHLTLANMTKEILQQMGLTVDHHKTAEDALLQFESTAYDLVLLDIVLPGKKDGIAMIEEIRAKTDGKALTPILAMSATIKTSQKIHALQVGANDFIIKPVIQAELIARVKNLVVARQLFIKMISQQQKLEQLAMTDQLTGLYNRYFLNSFNKKALSLAKRHKYPLSFIMIDLDKFKYINDTFGHEQGDEVLVNIAAVLQKSCRLEDIAVRLGGDEFLVVLPHCSLVEATKKANLLCAKVHAIQASKSTVVVAASFGISSTEQGSFNYKALFDLADQAAYQAKAQGGNTVHFLQI
ncbi:diguanylate cyclase [Colwellia psychrerythraea]|uniref:diguanylate cyclase n=1 Tax=Colwellia psychrerythraea TaxID=28229 RepID=A0A099L2Z0_COLPS|nr:diguanylate cyclase [Colwellia psychrerythraea]KGJ96820.1 response regulator receiver modulated diguanylate cyclase [Colwellia psychrerythraea]